MVQGRVYTSHHGYPLFPLPIPALTLVFIPFNWVYDDDIDRVSDEEAPQGQGGGVSGDDGDIGGSGANNVRSLNFPSSFGAVPLEEMYAPPMIRSRTKMCSLRFDATHFYHYTMTISTTST